MSDKLYVPNTFPTPNDLIDMVMPVVSEPAFKIVMLVTRHTLGWGGHNAGMAWQVGIGGAFGLRKLTGLSHQGIINGVRELLKLGLILVKKGPRNSRTPNQYALNLDLTTGQLVKNLDRSTTLTSPTSQRFRPVLVNNVYSLKINPEDKHNKRGAGAPPCLPPLLSVNTSPKIRSKPARPGAIAPEFASTVERVIGRMNQLAGTGFKVDSKLVVKGIVPRLRDGATEADCIAVVENRWSEWREKPDMRQYFNPETLFREGNFEKYLNAARLESEPVAKRTFVNG